MSLIAIRITQSVLVATIFSVSPTYSKEPLQRISSTTAGQDAQAAASYISGFAQTCIAHDSRTPSVWLKFVTFTYEPATQSVLIGSLVKDDNSGGGGGALTRTSLSELDPDPEITDLNDTMPVVLFHCTSGRCVHPIYGAQKEPSGQVILPGCTGKERLAKAFSKLIESAGGKRSGF